MKPPNPILFTWNRHDLGTLRDGTTLALVPMTPAAAEVLGSRVAVIDPWARYGFSGEALSRGFETTGDGAVRFQIQVDEKIAGVVTFRSPWLTGPYLQMLALLPGFQGRGVGASILAWFEHQAREGNARNIWLCVAQFNADAQRLYRRHGFQLVGMLPDLLRDGVDELLMRKRL